MIEIKNIHAYEVLDSRGNPTILADVFLSNNIQASSIVPSGASTGKYEAFELRDRDPKRFLGKGVLKACENVNTIISNSLKGMSPFDQNKIDALLLELDGTQNYSKLGANAVLSVSIGIAKAASLALNLPLYKYLGGVNTPVIPTPLLNIINGGSHANNNVDFQEYMIVPTGFENFQEALRASSEVYQNLKILLQELGYSTAVGDEGGFAPNLKHNEEAIELILKAIHKAGYIEGEDIYIAIDVASSEFLKDGKYHLKAEGRVLDSQELIQYYEDLIKKYPILSIEDALGEDDWNGWKELTQKLGKKVQLVGDDLFVTNAKILEKGIDSGIANAILIKPNQIGTLSQTMETIRLAQLHGYKCIMSHRSGESEDTFIADFAVALNLPQIKTGSTARSERIAKYNRLLTIQNSIHSPQYLGKLSFKT